MLVRSRIYHGCGSLDGFRDAVRVNARDHSEVFLLRYAQLLVYELDAGYVAIAVKEDLGDDFVAQIHIFSLIVHAFKRLTMVLRLRPFVKFAPRL